MSDVINLTDVSVVRSGSTILADVDWAVAEGETWVVLGPNGAGKTTLLQIAATLIHPSSGIAEILDERIGRVDVFDLRPRIGLASSALAVQVPDNERVRDVVMTSAWAVLGRWRETYDAADESRTMQLLSTWGLAGLAQQRFGTLSEGERKRTLIARALMSDPELLLLDEPAAGLDLGGREDLLRRIDDLADDIMAPAVVMVTHHVEEVPRATTHVLLLREGTVVAAGPVGEVLTSQNVSLTFGVEVVVEQVGDRWSAFVSR
ncbi:MAG: ABC transporter ATP-binding protein [Actinobacteria bacterium]|nr:ABC transporter ATP-binding protein [Actinomycetota bacterium]MCB8996023.1 ABC transporter ATP-binding protein [Actinomycetota bacterium]HRY08429.1 ABC transporter ATP-binding protein [Candidatus Nanopelagicales bacterium]